MEADVGRPITRAGVKVGVEISQLAIVARALPAIYAARHDRFARAVFLRAASVLIVAVVSIWFTRRAFAVTLSHGILVIWFRHMVLRCHSDQRPMANCRRNRREIGLLLVFVMLCVQLILARHATVHVIEDEHIGATSQQENRQESPVDRPAHHKDKTCQICLFSNDFSYTFSSVNIDVPTPDFTAVFAIAVPRNANARREISPLQARAPPNFLS